MARGGKREGAGAKLRSTSPSISKTIRFTQEEWDEIVIRAQKENIKGITPSEYVRKKALE